MAPLVTDLLEYGENVWHVKFADFDPTSAAESEDGTWSLSLMQLGQRRGESQVYRAGGRRLRAIRGMARDWRRSRHRLPARILV